MCHPELFARSIEYSEELNFHLDMFLGGVDDLLEGAPVVSGAGSTWTSDGRDAGVQLILSETSLGDYDVTLSVAPPGSSDFRSVVTGSVDRSSPDDVTKQLTFDLDALHRVFPPAATDHSSGQLAVTVERVTADNGDDRKRVVTYKLINFVPVYGDPHGPRSGTIDLIDEPGIGGAMVYDASTVFFCPANPGDLSADASTYVRWRFQNGMVDGRADAIATGGQIPTGDRWVGLSCRTISTSVPVSTGAIADDVTDNGFWLSKEEDAIGSTLAGALVAVEDNVMTDPGCDPAFGPVTNLDGYENDPTIPKSLSTGSFPGEF
jgi:hypothetical protein